jgi:hypothetical protein
MMNWVQLERDRQAARAGTELESAAESSNSSWMLFIDKANTIIVQRYVVPWMIALYGMSYQKNMKQELVKEMVITLSGTFEFAPFDLEEAAEEYPVGFAEVIKQIKTAAGTLSTDFHTL